MSEALLLIGAFAACCAGMGWFALAKDAHWRQLRGAQPLPPARARQLRLLGGAGLTLAAILCLAVDHVSQAALVWIMALAAAAVCVAFTLSFRPAALAPLVAFIPRGASRG